MKFSFKAIALAGALLWGGAILLVGVVNLVFHSYGMDFLQMAGSVYPGFHATHTVASVAIGTFEGLIDGAIAGLLFAWFYNSFAGTGAPRHS